MSKKAEKRIKSLEKKIAINEREWKRIYNNGINLKDSLNRLGDYRETQEPHKIGRKTITRLVGRKHWKEDFIDEDSGEVITVDRSEICTINGKSCDKFGVIFGFYEI